MQTTLDIGDIRRSRTGKIIWTDYKPLRLDETLTRALFVHNDFIRRLVARLLNKKITKQAYTFTSIKNKRFIDYFNISIGRAVTVLRSKLGLAAFMAIFVIFYVFFMFLVVSDLLLVLFSITVFYFAITFMIQIRVKGYTLIENVCLLLVAPINLFFMSAVYLLGFVVLLFRFIFVRL